MKAKYYILCILLSVLVFGTFWISVVPKLTEAQERVGNKEQELIYGRDLMTNQELNEHMMKMRNAKSDAERNEIRMEHHQAMKERAREMGMDMPDEPPAFGERGIKPRWDDGDMGRGMGRGGPVR